MHETLSRRRFLVRSLAGGLALKATFRCGSAEAGDVSWLAEVQRAPMKVPDVPLSPLLVGAEGQPVTTLAGWKVERERIRQGWLKYLGPMPAERPPVTLKVLKEENVPGCARQLVQYDSEQGLPVEAWIVRPTGASAATPTARNKAALVALHQTTTDTIDEIAGVRGPESQHLGLQLCRRGFVVVCPRCFLWQGTTDYKLAVARFKERHPQTAGMHKMLWDAQRGVDVALGLGAEIDSKRIGAVGHSLGAKETLYLAAFDDRICAAVASEGGLGFTSTNWDAPWYLGAGIRAKDFALNHHQLLAMVAPRPFLVLAGEAGNGAADGDRSWPYLAAALPVYRLFGEPARLGMLNHREGHTISPKTLERLTEWLETYVGSSG